MAPSLTQFGDVVLWAENAERLREYGIDGAQVQELDLNADAALDFRKANPAQNRTEIVLFILRAGDDAMHALAGRMAGVPVFLADDLIEVSALKRAFPYAPAFVTHAETQGFDDEPPVFKMQTPFPARGGVSSAPGAHVAIGPEITEAERALIQGGIDRAEASVDGRKGAQIPPIALIAGRCAHTPREALAAWSLATPVIAVSGEWADAVPTEAVLRLPAGFDADDIAAAIELLQRNPDFARAVGDAGRAHLAAAHAPDRCVECLVPLMERYPELLSRRMHQAIASRLSPASSEPPVGPIARFSHGRYSDGWCSTRVQIWMTRTRALELTAFLPTNALDPHDKTLTISKPDATTEVISLARGKETKFRVEAEHSEDFTSIDLSIDRPEPPSDTDLRLLGFVCSQLEAQ